MYNKHIISFAFKGGLLLAKRKSAFVIKMKLSQKGHQTSYKEKECLVCKNKFKQTSPRHKYCGSIKNKTGCSYSIILLKKRNYRKTHKKEEKERNKKYKNPYKRREYKLKKEYGIDIIKYKQLLLKQNEVCAICLRPEKTKHQSGKIKTLSIDHNHKTGKIRGLLCHTCNVGIGLLNDDPEILDNAKNYLLSFTFGISD